MQFNRMSERVSEWVSKWVGERILTLTLQTDDDDYARDISIVHNTGIHASEKGKSFVSIGPRVFGAGVCVGGREVWVCVDLCVCVGLCMCVYVWVCVCLCLLQGLSCSKTISWRTASTVRTYLFIYFIFICFFLSLWNCFNFCEIFVFSEKYCIFFEGSKDMPKPPVALASTWWVIRLSSRTTHSWARPPIGSPSRTTQQATYPDP